MSKVSLAVSVLALVISLVHARDGFPATIPNGNKVTLNGKPFPRVGHISDTDNKRNPFGLDYERIMLTDDVPNGKWNELCEIDSDKDGKTNGEELGDPNCAWTGVQDNDDLDSSLKITHPGFDEENDELPEEGGVNLVQLHGILMLLAWLLFAPVGILAAIFFKYRKGVFWFKIHRVCLGTTVYLTLVAYAVALYQFKEFRFGSVHTRAGQFVVLFTVIQPLNGIFRVHIGKDGSKSNLRYVWETFHQMFGRIILLTAVIAIYFGVAGGRLGGEAGTDGLRAIAIIMLIALAVATVFNWIVFRNAACCIATGKSEQHTKDLEKAQQQQGQQQGTTGQTAQSGTNQQPSQGQPVVEEAKSGQSNAPQSETLARA